MALCALFIVVLAYFAYADARGAMEKATPWVNPLVTRSEVAAVDWAEANTAERDLFVTDIFGGELLMGRSLREGLEGGDWAIVPNVVQRMVDADKFYDANSSQEAWDIAKKYGAKYAWVPDRQLFAGFSWKYPQQEKFANSTHFELVFSNGTNIYRVK